PDIHADEPRDVPHVGFAKTRLDERALYAGALRGFEARTMVAEVVEIRAVRDLGELPLFLFGARDVVKLALAVKAAIRPVRDVARPVHLVGFDETVVCPEAGSNPRRVVTLGGGEARAHCRHAHGVAPENFRRHGEDERTV